MTLIVAWHSSGETDLCIRRGLHVGTPDQASMRGGRHLHRLEIEASGRVPRLRDRGSWDPRRLARHARDAGIAVYLNRHEGIPLTEFDHARGRIDLDAVPDGIFRRLVPSAADSWIILDPATVRSIERVEVR